MGRTHALTGWCAGFALAPIVGATSLHQQLMFAVTSAGYALLPDLDHPGASASRLLGPVTRLLSGILRRLSAALYALTKGPRDEKSTGQHRHLSHTALFAIAVGGLTSAGTAAGGPWAVAGVVLFGLLLAEAALGDWLLPVSAVSIYWWLETAGPAGVTQAEQLTGWLGIAVGAGCLVHCFGDALTESGCPILFPILIAGETWYELRPPKKLRFKTGKKVENLLIFPAFVLLAVLLYPGLVDTLHDGVKQVFDTPAAQVEAPAPPP